MTNKIMKEKNRIEWIDICKFLGILAIFVGHFATSAGDLYPFVFKYHVPLFFFLSGCMDTFDKEKKYIKYVWKKIKTILLPFFVFALISVIINSIITNADTTAIKMWLYSIAKGCIRDQFFAQSLWFLSCLFTIQIIFKLFKYCKLKTVMLILSVICTIIYTIYIYPTPPNWFFNLDSALWYITFYAIGFISFPHINNLFDSKKRMSTIVFFSITLISIIFSALIYKGINPITSIANVFGKTSILIEQIIYYITALILITFNLCISKLLVGTKIICKIGEKTLYLCGNEYIIKNLIQCLVSIVGLGINIVTPFASVIYSFILIILTYYLLIPIELKITTTIKDNIKNYLKNCK